MEKTFQIPNWLTKLLVYFTIIAGLSLTHETGGSFWVKVLQTWPTFVLLLAILSKAFPSKEELIKSL